MMLIVSPSRCIIEAITVTHLLIRSLFTLTLFTMKERTINYQEQN